MVFFISENATDTASDAITALVDVGGTGSLRIYDGTPPVDADTALSSNTLLAQITLSATSFGAAASGICTLAGVPLEDSSADATGTASFFRILAGNGTTVVIQGTVGTSGADLNLNTVAIVISAAVEVTSFTFEIPES